MGHIRTRGAEIVDASGRPLLLRGVGLGNWLLPEGYMWRFGDGLASPRQIEARIARLIGADAAADFWKRFRDVFVAEDDIARIAALGFDHVRLPINSRVVITDDGELLAEGFALIDKLIDWCARHGLWVLLDLHGAPGGQTGTNIDDSPHGKPELFMEERYRRLTVRLWREIARRYRGNPTVLGYDLLNEPLPEQWQHVYPRELIELYTELTAAIREVDPDHLIMYEGPQWATDVSVFTEVLDPNSVLQFHRYWCAPERASIDDYLRARDRLGVPIYMGEGGENTPEWIYTATRLYEQHGIGWNFWPWKKLGTRTSPVSARVPDGWERIADPADDVDAATAQRLLDTMLDNVALDRCEVRDDVLNALFGRAPLRLPAWGHAETGPAAPSRFAGHDEATLEAIWHHTAGEPYADPLAVTLQAGDELRFPLAARPAGWTIDAADPAAFDAHWSGDALVIRATTSGELRGLDLTGRTG
ncbi:cellulase family glycosylhydrolase [Actinoplanes sp. NPDC049548]|uniref:glycoside hydrolase family 5 protein n=1 Tax=Actinoplanes sp. NPDC049548 TaxID=3155152 RepID=UPI003432CBDD